MRWFLFFAIFAIFLSETAHANAPINLGSPSAILVEQTTGRVLYARNERERRYPASMTKMLTALVVLDVLEPDYVIVVGSEIQGMPAGFATNVHFEGETITVRMLLKSMLIRSSNETGRTLALNVIRHKQDRRNVPWDEANNAFSALLNERARELGARGTHFNNSFGFHNENHFTTAYDMALITRAFMDNPYLAEMVGLRTFTGNSLFGVHHPSPFTREYSWVNTNLLLPGAPHGHPYIIGAKTGFTNAAGHCLAGAAYNNGLQLATVVMGGTDAMRWQDTRHLMDYGFFNFRFREIAHVGEILDEVRIENPRLGDSETLSVVLGEPRAEALRYGEAFLALLSHAEYAVVTKTIMFDPLLHVATESGIPYGSEKSTLRAPIEEGAVVGTVLFSADGMVLLDAPILAARAVYERNFDSDMDYYLATFFGNVFTRRALPYYFGIFGTAFGIFGLVSAVKANYRAGRNISKGYERHRRRY